MVRRTEPSRTALSAARHRAEHQILDRAALFEDPLALPIAGFGSADAVVEAAPGDPVSVRLRWFVAARSRFAEERAVAAVESGARQVVVLGAGLDTFGYRWRPPSGVRLFEVDLPSTQAWKRQRLAEIGLREPKSLTYVPVDLENDDPATALRQAGIDDKQRSVILWLGVLPYLAVETVAETLTALATLGAVDVVFDYGEPPEHRDARARRDHELHAARVAALGEPLLTFLSPSELRRLLDYTRWKLVEDIDAARYIRRVLGRGDDGRPSPAHLVLAHHTPDQPRASPALPDRPPDVRARRYVGA
jgi:methyltransferase (TIGR00027 family)